MIASLSGFDNADEAYRLLVAPKPREPVPMRRAREHDLHSIALGGSLIKLKDAISDECLKIMAESTSPDVCNLIKPIRGFRRDHFRPLGDQHDCVPVPGNPHPLEAICTV
jgi:hypothetical protein